jgi:hypothetical protein
LRFQEEICLYGALGGSQAIVFVEGILREGVGGDAEQGMGIGGGVVDCGLEEDGKGIGVEDGRSD